MNIIERAETFDYGHGKATIQLVRGETDSPTRLWNGVPQCWWNIPKGEAFVGMAERIYESMLKEERKMCSHD